MNDPRRRAIIGQRVTPPADPQADPSLWVAAEPVVVEPVVAPPVEPTPIGTGHRRPPADADFDELMQRAGLSPLFVADHVVYRKTRGRR